MNNKIINFIKKKNKSKIISLTAYSKNIASIIDKHCDLVLVGDSLGSVLYNFSSTKFNLVPNAKTTSAFEINSIAALDPLYPRGPTAKEWLPGKLSLC